MNMTNLQQTKKDETFYKPILINYMLEILTAKLKKFHFLSEIFSGFSFGIGLVSSLF